MRTQTAEPPTADDFRAVHFVGAREVIAAEPPKTVTDAEGPAPSEDIMAQMAQDHDRLCTVGTNAYGDCWTRLIYVLASIK